MKRRRVLMIAFTLYRSDTRVRRLADALVQRGDEVDFLCLAEDDLPEEIRGVRLFGVTRRRLGSQSMARLLIEYVRFTLASMWQAARRHRENPYDVVHVHTMPDFLVVAGLIPKLRGARLILDIHDTFPELFAVRKQVSLRHPIVRVLRAIEVWSARLAHRVIAVHEPHRQRLIEHGIPPSKIDVVMNLPDEAIFPRQEPDQRGATEDEGVRATYHGTISKHLALDLIVDAATELKESGAPIHIHMYGGGNCAEELEEKIKVQDLQGTLDVDPRFRPAEEIVREVRHADIGVIPCQTNAATDLMLPTKLLEYVRMGIPCITPRTEAIGHYFDDSMVEFCDAEDPEGLAAKLTELASNPQRRHELARNAQKFTEAYSWDRHREDYFAVIDG